MALGIFDIDAIEHCDVCEKRERASHPMKLSDFDILSFGNTIQIVGVIYEGEGKTLTCYFPDETPPSDPAQRMLAKRLELSQEDWQKLIRQTDMLETEILAKAPNGDLTKIVMRKSQRQIDQNVSWSVWRRDKCACRWCGIAEGALTVDHLVTWESGGPSTVENLVSSCRGCNKTRGKLDLAAWFEHPHYKQASKKLTEAQRQSNLQLLDTVSRIPRVFHIRSR